MPPPQALRFSHGFHIEESAKAQRETRVAGDELQGTMGRVNREKNVWIRGRCSMV